EMADMILSIMGKDLNNDFSSLLRSRTFPKKKLWFLATAGSGIFTKDFSWIKDFTRGIEGKL
ncbi:hypothetical protein, partial [Neobacillus sp. 19]|uniref:hypothetical protein n=1 Tax=Neobacillus sp. 19 TaxID=3394458 RepID=UPI003BF737BF